MCSQALFRGEFCVLSHYNHLLLEGWHSSAVHFQAWNMQNVTPDAGKSLIYNVSLCFLLFSPPCSLHIITFCWFLFTLAVHCPQKGANPGKLDSSSHSTMVTVLFLLGIPSGNISLSHGDFGGFVPSCLQNNTG